MLAARLGWDASRSIRAVIFASTCRSARWGCPPVSARRALPGWRKIVGQINGGGNPGPELEMAELSLTERAGRTLYPVFEKRERPILKQFVAVPTRTTIFFLFQGDGPLDLTVYAPGPIARQVVPRVDRAGFDRLQASWWRDFAPAGAAAQDVSRDYPPLVEEYLVNTLSRRLQLPIPPPAPVRDDAVR